MQEVGDSGSLKLTATNGNVRLRLALSNDGAGRCVVQHCPMHAFIGWGVCPAIPVFFWIISVCFATGLTAAVNAPAAEYSIQACRHAWAGLYLLD